MELKNIDKNIKTIGGNAAKLNALIHETAVAIVQHAQDHGDCTRALKLVQAMPKSFRRGLLINWFGTYSPIGMNVDTGKVAFWKPEQKLYRPFDVDGARANPFFEGKEADKEDLPDTTLEAANKMIFGLAKRLQKQIDDGKVAANDLEAVTLRISALNDLGKAAAIEARAAAPAAQAA